jgi:hypothetical protein
LHLRYAASPLLFLFTNGGARRSKAKGRRGNHFAVAQQKITREKKYRVSKCIDPNDQDKKIKYIKRHKYRSKVRFANTEQIRSQKHII